MKKAIQISYNESFEKKCGYAAAAGFEAVAVNFNDMPDRSQRVWDAAPENILGVLEKNKLECVQTHLSYYDLRISAEITDSELEKAIINSIMVAGKIKTPWNVYHPRSAVNAGFCASKTLEENNRRISGYLETAEKYGTGIALENLPIFKDIIPAMPFYPNNYGDLCELVDSLKSERVGICWDTGHANLMEINQAEAIRYMGKRLKVTHIHNNFKFYDLHLTPDNGNIDWKSVMTAMVDIGYCGPLTLETHCLYDDDGLLQAFARYNFECLKFLERLQRSE